LEQKINESKALTELVNILQEKQDGNDDAIKY